MDSSDHSRSFGTFCEFLRRTVQEIYDPSYDEIDVKPSDADLMPPPPLPPPKDYNENLSNDLNISPVNSTFSNIIIKKEPEDFGYDMCVPLPTIPTVPFIQIIGEKKLDTPLAAMLPSKYKNMDVTKLFPEFRHHQVLRFSRLFGPGKPSSLPQIWRGVKKKKKKKNSEERDSSNVFRIIKNISVDNSTSQPPLPEEVESDDEAKLMKPEEKNRMGTNNESYKSNELSPGFAAWRLGPSKLWYDMLNVPESGEGFDYGFRLKEPSEKKSEDETKEVADDYPDDAYFMVTQYPWEDDVIWNGDEVKHKVLAKLNNRNNAAGWVPSSHNRTASAFSEQVECEYSEDKDDTWWSIFPVENEDLIHGHWEDDIIWNSEAMDKIPEPKVLTLDLNDENIILRIPDDPDPNSIASNEPVKEKKDMVRKSRILLGKAGVISEPEPPSPVCLL
ncbi:transcription initiation factor TFIID subunit 1 [Trichonephila clavipes]|nr:transcription initiation factor TFIID subunit 1 [Trichonephila clavipes]